MLRESSTLESVAQTLPFAHRDAAPQAQPLGRLPLDHVSGDLSPVTGHRPVISASTEIPVAGEFRLDHVAREGWPERAEVRRPAGRFLAWSKRYVAALVVLDAMAGMLVVALAPVIPRAMHVDDARQLLLVAIGGLAWPLGVSVARGYERAKIGVGGDELRAVLRAGVFLIAAGSVASVLFTTNGLSALVVLGTPIAAFVSIASRFAARKVLHHQQRQGRNVRHVIVVGSTYAAADLSAVLEREVHAGMQVIGVCVPAGELGRAHEAGLTVLGDLDRVPALIGEYGADAVAVTGGEATRHHYLRELSWALEGAGVELLVHPGLIEVAGPRMHIRPYVGLPLLHVEQPHFTGWRRLVKRGADISFTSLGLVVAAPVLLGIAAAIKLSDGGPVIFRQTRVGLDGSTFTMFKFRSMHTDAESRLADLRAQHPHLGTMFKLADDPRITTVGRFLRRFSLDELPQLINVLAGSMSLVGPRPPLQTEVDQYEDHARRRLLVTPGLTGLWQVSGRSLLSWEETVRLDLRYVENWTLTLDLLILWKTFFAVLTKRGAF
jgi:exopolysaccharide biosynthesis polyprenyl glycosylphosphotransferase